MTAEPASNRRISILAVTLVWLVMAACVAGCTPSRFTRPFLTVMPQSAAILPGTIIATATCPQGSTRLGGGFLVAPENSNRGMVVRGSYPSDANGWTLEVENTTPNPNDSSALLVVAYCAQRSDLSLNATVQRVGSAVSIGGGEGTPKQMINAPCTAPAVLTGGGYYVDGPLNSIDALYNAGILESAPDGTAWHVEVGEALHASMTRLVRAFAVCTTGLPAGAMSEVATTPVAGALTTTIAPCADPNTYTTAGGFRLNGPGHNNPSGSLAKFVGRAFESAVENDFARWRIDTNTLAPSDGGIAPVTAVVLCAPIP